MSLTETTKVKFDPGFSQFSTDFPKEAYSYLDEISSLKQNHQKKFAFTHLESQVVPIIKQCASFQLGCILWGSYLFWKYKNDTREIEGNTVISLSEEEKSTLNYSDEIDFILGFIDKFEKSAKFYLKRSSRIDPAYIKYFESYKQFVKLNDDFKNLKLTSEIKLPDEVAHFENHSEQKLNELKQKIDEIINLGNLENILHISFYN
ncbi:MAG: hypothetical protein A2039_00430 [Candidatus Melainabacteria bacterium GWA2_34_9]|nr:MAG: hypothetical protein A2039_00430 [Candidatus Melainabacteria bacterium GWA2_34_9]